MMIADSDFNQGFSGAALKIEWLDRISYRDALALQEQTVENLRHGNGSEQVFFLEHDPVFTMGRHLDRSSLKDVHLPAELFEVNRGGQATYHEPGQLVCYPVLDLGARRRDLHVYLRFLEDVIIELLASFGISSGRREGMTGVWVGGAKIASIGVGVRRWCSMHGFALNVCNDLGGFEHIIPCGLSGVKMTSLERETGVPVPVQVVAARAMDLFPVLLEKTLSLAHPTHGGE